MLWHDRFMRIVSLLPSTTEILFDLGAGDDVVGVTFECDHPPEARERTIVSTSALPEGLDSAGIDAFVAAAMRAGQDLYHLDEGALSGLDADLVVTQDLCAVCAVDVSVVDDALAHLGCTADVLTIDPHTLEEVLASVLTLGSATGHAVDARRLVESLEDRLDRVREQVDGRTGRPPRVLLLEWTDPPFAPGHWVPEMITIAGGVPDHRRDRPEVGPDHLGAGPRRGSRPGRLCPVRLRPGRVRPPSGSTCSGPACCPRTCRSGRWTPTRRYARPGPRLVDGVEDLARIIGGEEPEPAASPAAALRKRRWRVSGGAVFGRTTPPLGIRGMEVEGPANGHSMASDDAINQRREPQVRCACLSLGSRGPSGEQYGTNSNGIFCPFHSRPTYPSKSCRVSTPTGRPSSCTSSASASRRAAIASSRSAPAPTVGSGSSMCSSTGSARRASPA